MKMLNDEIKNVLKEWDDFLNHLIKAKRDITKLVPVKKEITRNGKTYMTTVYVKPDQVKTTQNKQKFEIGQTIVYKRVDKERFGKIVDVGEHGLVVRTAGLKTEVVKYEDVIGDKSEDKSKKKVQEKQEKKATKTSEIDSLKGVNAKTKEKLAEIEKKTSYELKLYHATPLENLESILDKGLIPGFKKPSGQDWLGDYSGKGIYFHSDFPKHELDSVEMFDLDNKSEMMAVPVIIEVKKTINPSDPQERKKLIPEEENPLHDQVNNSFSGLASAIEGGAVVWLGKIDSNDIVKVTFPDDERIKNYVIKNLKLEDGIKVVFGDKEVELPKKEKTSKKKEAKPKIESPKGRLKAVDVQKHLRPIRKALGTKRYKEFLQAHGITWERNNEHAGADTMRASMAAKKWLEAGNVFDENILKKFLNETGGDSGKK